MASANLDSYFRTIRTASKGEDVRDAIIGAARNAGKVRTNASTLEGADPKILATWDKFVELRDEIYKKLQCDTAEQFADYAYAKESKNVMTSGELYSVLNTYVRPALAYMMKFENDPMANKDLYEAMDYYISTLEKAKADMAKAIKAKGEDPDKVKEFRDFAQLIMKIGEHTKTIEEHLDITDVSKKEYGGTKTAYKSVSVNIGANELKASKNGTYVPDNGNVYTKITVEVNGKSGSSRPGRSTGKDSGVIVTEDGLLSDGLFTQNTDTEPYTPDGGAYGWMAFTVDVQVPDVDENSVFTVTFYDEGTELASVEVPAYGTAYMENPPSTKLISGQTWYFQGWEPLPIHIVADTDVRATWSPDAPPEGSEITDTWETIALNKGAQYPIGSYKTLTVDGKTFVMEKVANGEDTGSTSTWISKTIESIGTVEEWSSSQAREYLNSTFIEAIEGTSGLESLANALVPVKKYTLQTISRSVVDDSNPARLFIEVQTQDRVWVPSARELFFPSADKPLNYDSIIAFYANGKDPSTGQYRVPNKRPPKSAYEPSFDNLNYTWVESKGPSYKQKYGASTYEMVWDANGLGDEPQHLSVKANPLNPSALIKTKNGNAANYTTRSAEGYGELRLVKSDGTMGSPVDRPVDQGAPIGFCL